MKKLTLSMDEKDIQVAHRLAKRHNTSISNMFSRLLRAISRRDPEGPKDLPPMTRQAIGLLKLPKGKTDRQLVEEALFDKHGLTK